MRQRPGALGPDPIFLMMLGLCPVVIGAASFRDGIVLGGGVAFATLVAGLVAPFAQRLVAPPLRALSNAASVAGAAVLLSIGVAAFAPEAWNRLQIWIALIGVNCMALAASGGPEVEDELARYPSRIAAALRFLASSLLIASIRELLSGGSLVFYADAMRRIELRAIPVEGYLLRIAALPSGAFILFGLALAASRLLRRAAKRSA